MLLITKNDLTGWFDRWCRERMPSFESYLSCLDIVFQPLTFDINVFGRRVDHQGVTGGDNACDGKASFQVGSAGGLRVEG